MKTDYFIKTPYLKPTFNITKYAKKTTKTFNNV